MCNTYAEVGEPILILWVKFYIIIARFCEHESWEGVVGMNLKLFEIVPTLVLGMIAT